MTDLVSQNVETQTVVSHEAIVQVAQEAQEQVVVDNQITTQVEQETHEQTMVGVEITTQVEQETQEQTTIGVPGPRGVPGATGPMGSGVAWRGAYNPTTAYEFHDAVTYLGSSYACSVPCTGVVPTETSNWELVASKGDTGADGVSDIPGPKGDTGNTGAAGAKGDTGSQGPQGIQGVQGQQGETGVQGIQGVKGDTGADSTVVGPKGETGTAGSTGADGIDGVTPVKGVDYFDGVDGSQGIQGIQGERGVAGADSIVAGPEGEQGVQGETGAAGATTWAGITDKPSTFVPASHAHALTDLAVQAAETVDGNPTASPASPAVIALTEQQVLGRITGGHVKGLSIAELSTLLGGIGTMAAATATDYVAKALFDAYTILMATTDNTPVALTVGEQTLLGRITGGAIAALSVAQIRTLLGITAAGAALIDDTDTATQRATLGAVATGDSRLSDARTPVAHNHGLNNPSFVPSAVIDSLTADNFRTVLFGNANNGYNLAPARWNTAPAVLGLIDYGTMVAWGAFDTHGFLALNYGTPGAVVGGGAVDTITWSKRLAFSDDARFADARVAADVYAWAKVATAPFVGPASATDNAIVRFDGNTGKLVQNISSVIIDDVGNVGIGTATPDSPIHVNGGPAMTAGWARTATLQAAYPVLAFNSYSKWAGIGYDNGVAMRFWVNASTNDVVAGTLAMNILINGDIWGVGNISGASFTDRTPVYEGDALAELVKIKGKDGKIDHSTLPAFARHVTTLQVASETEKDKDGKAVMIETQEEGRDLGAMISMLTVAVKQLNDRLLAVENN